MLRDFDFIACFPCFCRLLHFTDKLIWFGKSSHFQTNWQKFSQPDINRYITVSDDFIRYLSVVLGALTWQIWWPFGMLFESFSEDFICSHPIINNNGDVLYCVNLWEMCLDVVARSPHRCEDAVYYISNKSSPFSLSVHYYDMTWHVAP